MIFKNSTLLLFVIFYLSFLSSCHSVNKGKEQTTDEISDTVNLPGNDKGDDADNETKTKTKTKTKTIPMIITVNELTGRVSPENDTLWELIENPYASRQGMYMRKEAYEAFKKMEAAAKDEGVELTIISAFRSFNHQKRIWENKWTGRQMLTGNIDAQEIEDENKRAKEILKFSSMPGTSRHHWGTDIDINSLNNYYFETGKGAREYKWLVENAAEFGFCQPYIPKNGARTTGYEEEKWHWSYMPIAKHYLIQFNQKVTISDISGFQGEQTAEPLDVIENYVNGINPVCKETD